MNDLLPGFSWSNPIWYGMWRIYRNTMDYGPDYDWVFCHDDYDGAPDANDHRYGHANTVDDCKQEIDNEHPTT